LPEPVEVAVYYLVSEALANVAKHAEASMVEIDLEEVEQVVRVAVRDDGVGGARLGRGSGLIGLRDRIEALGWRIEPVDKFDLRPSSTRLRDFLTPLFAAGREAA